MVRWRSSQVYVISLLIFSTRISSMPKSIACHQFELVKDKHNVILIIVSSKWFNSLLRRFIKILDFSCFILSFLEFQVFLHYIVVKLHLNHCKASTLFFSSFISFDHSSATVVPNEGSTWWFIKYFIPSRSFHRDSFLRRSSIVHLAIRCAILSSVSIEVVLCHSW